MQVEVRVMDPSNARNQLNQVSIQFDLYDKIKEAQQRNAQIRNIMQKVLEGELKEFKIEDNVLGFRRKLCVPDVAEIKKEIMKKAHCTRIQLIWGAQKCIRICVVTSGGME